MGASKFELNVDYLSAWGTWLVVAGSALYLMHTNGNYSIERLLLAACGYLGFMLTWQQGIRDKPFTYNVATRWVLVAIQYCLVLMIFFIVPYTYTAILLTIWSAQLPYLLSFRKCLLWSPVWSSALGFIYAFYWHEDYVIVTATLFWTFNVFALVMVNATLQERRAREATLQLNRELITTQALLSEASKQNERVRIARNIHDLLGHHLTALTINLQVAERLSEGEAKEKVVQCHSLARLLLGDVREAVSEIRQKSSIDLRQALQKLVDEVSELDIRVNCDEVVNLQDVAMAEALLRCVQESVTNCLKHSNATQLNITIERNDTHINLTISDDGKLERPVTPGNGLRGMRERIVALGGSFGFDCGNPGLSLHVSIPEQLA